MIEINLHRRFADYSTNPVFRTVTIASLIIASTSCFTDKAGWASDRDDLKNSFVAPPDDARPWVYWYFMDGYITREGLHADLEAMKKAGVGGAIFLDVNIGIPKGPVDFMSPQWQQLFAYAVSEAKRLGIQVALGTGPGWTGSGGPWITPELSMQHLVASTTKVTGPIHFDALLPRPAPRIPYFGEATLTPELRDNWLEYYRDEAVIAFPTPTGNARLEDADHKALYYRAPYSSKVGTQPRIPTTTDFAFVPTVQTISTSKMQVLTGKLGADGHLSWNVPPGNWTILRFGRTPTGQTTRPAPTAGLGFESDKFSRAAIASHLDAYTETLLKQLGPNYGQGKGGLTMLHFDSWEMGSQNWSPQFRQEFIERRGYDPLPLLPTMLGYVVGSPERSERFLWDMRQTASELVVENHAGFIRDYAHRHGLKFSVEPYDMNPSADLDLGATADLPMGEFWSKGYGFQSEYSCFEAVSVGHTNGKKVIGAEAFTALSNDAWLQHPGSMKAQLDWALCAGINKFVIHRYQHQSEPGKYPGMTMGPYGVHWESTQTWWDMVPAFHRYIASSSELLRQGLPVADILYLTPEGAPQVFTPPVSALTSGLPDHKGYSFDGCSPKNLIRDARVKGGRIVFQDGMSYRVLVLPSWPTMTPELLRKITSLVEDGATVVGNPPKRSPSLQNYPASDALVHSLAEHLWGVTPYPATRKVGKGSVVFASVAPEAKSDSNAEKWIWLAEGDPVSRTPTGTRYFHTTLQIDSRRTIQSATAIMTADNSFEFRVNGHLVGSGDDFHDRVKMDISSCLQPGNNEIAVTAINAGDAPNPAGLIGSIVVSYSDGQRQTLLTGSSWLASSNPNGPWNAAQELGPIGMSPWNLDTKPQSIYPDYVTTARLLESLGTAPDFSATAPMRYVHRHTKDCEIYFVANSGAEPIDTLATFRVSGYRPEWWDVVTEKLHELTDYSTSNGLTRIPLRLVAYESGFVVFRKPSATPIHLSSNFPTYKPILTLERPWTVSFDPKWGGPTSIVFPTLDDWSLRSEPGIKYYSGKAVYRSSFDMPGGLQAPLPHSLSLGTVKNIASVRLNGTDLGVVWCDPWRIDIPAGILKATANQLEITVANLWVNKLIEDSGKPKQEQTTSTTFNPLKPDSPLQPSGLLGPVVLEEAHR